MADLSWAVQDAEKLFYSVRNTDKDAFITTACKLFRNQHSSALARAKGRIKVRLRKEAISIGLSDDQMTKLFKSMENLK